MIFISVPSFSLWRLTLAYRADINTSAPAVDSVLVFKITRLFVHDRGHIQKHLAFVYALDGMKAAYAAFFDADSTLASQADLFLYKRVGAQREAIAEVT